MEAIQESLGPQFRLGLALKCGVSALALSFVAATPAYAQQPVAGAQASTSTTTAQADDEPRDSDGDGVPDSEESDAASPQDQAAAPRIFEEQT